MLGDKEVEIRLEAYRLAGNLKWSEVQDQPVSFIFCIPTTCPVLGANRAVLLFILLLTTIMKKQCQGLCPQCLSETLYRSKSTFLGVGGQKVSWRKGMGLLASLAGWEHRGHGHDESQGPEAGMCRGGQPTQWPGSAWTRPAPGLGGQERDRVWNEASWPRKETLLLWAPLFFHTPPLSPPAQHCTSRFGPTKY